MTIFSSRFRKHTNNPVNRVLAEIRAVFWRSLERHDLEGELAMLQKGERFYPDRSPEEVEHARKVLEKVLAL